MKSELVPGMAYAWRANPRAIEPDVARVQFVGPVRASNARIRWRGGEFNGLEEWVPTRQLLCQWGAR